MLDGASALHDPAFSIISASQATGTYASPVTEVCDVTTQPLVEKVPAHAPKRNASFIVKGVPVKLTEA